jgi:GTP-binding protein HflX
MVFNKIDAYTFDYWRGRSNDRKKHQDTLRLKWKSTWMSRVGEENALFISATNKENFEEFRERVYEAVRHIHVTVFLQ